VRRCDIPSGASFSSRRSDSVYAFLEMDSSRDAAIAYTDLHGRRFLGGSINIQVPIAKFNSIFCSGQKVSNGGDLISSAVVIMEEIGGTSETIGKITVEAVIIGGTARLHLGGIAPCLPQ
jgi:hypothetical protein